MREAHKLTTWDEHYYKERRFPIILSILLLLLVIPIIPKLRRITRSRILLCCFSLLFLLIRAVMRWSRGGGGRKCPFFGTRPKAGNFTVCPSTQSRNAFLGHSVPLSTLSVPFSITLFHFQDVQFVFICFLWTRGVRCVHNEPCPNSPNVMFVVQ